MEDVQATVLEALASKAECRAQITDDLAKLSIDSLAMAELALEIEQRLKIRLNDEVLDQRTVKDLVSYVQALVDKQRASAGP
jgi:acyl carrier protein